MIEEHTGAQLSYNCGRHTGLTARGSQRGQQGFQPVGHRLQTPHHHIESSHSLCVPVEDSRRLKRSRQLNRCTCRATERSSFQGSLRSLARSRRFLPHRFFVHFSTSECKKHHEKCIDELQASLSIITLYIYV